MLFPLFAIMAMRCPSCGQELTSKGYRRHMAFCSPDLLDPDGWANGDQQVVLQHIDRRHRRGSPENKALHLRFGKKQPTTSQRAVSNAMGWGARRTRDTICRMLHSIPPVAESLPVEVLFEDCDVIAVAKPAGVGVTPSHRLRGGSMLNRVAARIGSTPHPCHRLDLNTSGVLVFAKSPAAATKLMGQFEARQVTKAYVALCSGTPQVTFVDVALCRVDGGGGSVRRPCADGEAGGKSARSTLQIVGVSSEPLAHEASDDGSATTEATSAMVLVRPHEGRAHQVRVHCQCAGAPIVGDDLYGGDMASTALDRHALHALALTCKHPTSGRRLEIAAPLPADMREAARQLGITHIGQEESGGREGAAAEDERVAGPRWSQAEAAALRSCFD